VTGVTGMTTTAGRVSVEPRAAPGGHVMRALGLYIAGAAATIQLLDVFADRLDLPEQAFVLVVVIAILGLPVTAAAVALRAVARAERSPRRMPKPAGRERSARGAAPSRPAPMTQQRSGAPPDSALARRLEVALSHHRIATLHLDNGDRAAAAEQLDRFVEHARVVQDELDRVTSAARGIAVEMREESD
jgi:hypothetical protein